MKVILVARSLVLLVLVPLFTIACSIIATLVVGPFASRAQADAYIRFWARGLLKLGGVRVRVSGLENLQGLKSAVIVSNHLSHYDIPVLFAALPLSFRMVAKIELFKIPFFGQALKATGFVPVERETGEGLKNNLGDMARRFGRGESVWIAPEGTRQKELKIGQFKSGAFYLALKEKQPVLPVTILGTQAVLPKNGFFISQRRWRQDVHVRVGSVIRPDAEGISDRKTLRDRVRAAIESDFSNLREELSAPNGDHRPRTQAADYS